MPDVGGQLLDVALGLTFIFLALSLVCSLVQELLATALSWRSELLERGIRQMLSDPDAALNSRFSEELLGSPFIREKLGRKGVAKGRKVPSYLSSRTFSLALFDTLTHNQEGEDVTAKIGTALKDDSLLPPGVKRQLELMLDDAEGALEKFHDQVQTWYDDTMDRVSGWYRRRAQVALFVIGLVVAIGANADTFDVTNRLWTDAPVRNALVAQATDVSKIENVDKLEAELEKRGGKLEAVKQFKLPLGWTADNGEPSDLGFGGGKENPFGWLAGILVAAVALSFGAPFWFDALSKLGRLRIAGKKPEKAAG